MKPAHLIAAALIALVLSVALLAGCSGGGHSHHHDHHTAVVHHVYKTHKVKSSKTKTLKRR